MATLAVALFVLAQPRMFCAVHCLILDHIGGDTAVPSATSVPGQHLVADGAADAPAVDMVCGFSGTILTSAPAIPVGSVGPATLAAVEFPVFGDEPPEAGIELPLWAPVPAPPTVDTPPPRV